MANDGTTGLTEAQCPLTQTLQFYNDIKNIWQDYTCNDLDDGATDSQSSPQGCSHYTANTGDCGSYDDSDFFSYSMCCACGGGDTCTDIDFGAFDSNDKNCAHYSAGTAGTCGDADTDSFVAATMCCACQGGKKIITGDQTKPVDVASAKIYSCERYNADGTANTNCVYEYDFDNTNGDYNVAKDPLLMRWKVEDTRSNEVEGTNNLEFTRTVRWECYDDIVSITAGGH